MKNTIVLICLSLSILACTETMELAPVDDVKTNNETLDLMGSAKSNTVNYYTAPIIKNVNHYAKWLAQDLFSGLDFPSNKEIFVVSDFSLLDSGLDQTNHFGRQLTEALMHEVNRTGFSVIDMKATGFIRMTERGDMFFHSKDYKELSTKTSANNIITGTMTRHKGGYLVNARIVALETHALISSAQAFVPYDVVDAVLLEELTVVEPVEVAPTGIPLKAFVKKAR